MEKMNETKSEMTLLSIYDEDLHRLAARVGKDRAMSTLVARQQARRYVALFLREKMERLDIPLNGLQPQFIYEFSVWLSADCKLRGGTVWLACQQLKGVVSRAHQRGLIRWNPFCGFHIAKRIRPREYLTEEEIMQLITHRFKKKSLAFARDIFVFACFTGLAFIDIKELLWDHIREINGAKWIVSRRHKTKVPFQMKLLPIAQGIIQRNGMTDQTYVFGNLQYRTLCKQITKVMAEVGFGKRVTLHCARHSFAILALNKGMPIESVSRILGHTKITTTQIYAKITMQKLEQDISAFANKLVCFMN